MVNLYIPKKIHVGFNLRKDTYTGKLGYVIYEDEKGVRRKEQSWNSWRDKTIEPVSFDNTPQSSFVFNRGIQRGGWDWYSKGRSVIRVYDQRDFEFEITVDNLIGILMHSDVSKRDIVEECVYAWAGPELVLLPVNSQDYIDAVKYSDKQAKKLSAKSLVKGHTYSKKKSNGEFVYLGYYEWFDYKGSSRYARDGYDSYGKKHVFYNIADGGFDISNPSSSYSECIVNEVHSEYANFVDKFVNSRFYSNVVKFDTIHNEDETVSYNRNKKFYKIIGDVIYRFNLPSWSDSEIHSPSIRLETATIDGSSIGTYSLCRDGNIVNDFEKEFVCSINVENSYYYSYNNRKSIKLDKKKVIKYITDNGFKNTLMAVNGIGNTFVWGGSYYGY